MSVITSGAWQIYDEAKKRSWQKEIDLVNDALKVVLLDATYAPDLAAHKNFADVSAKQIAAGNGYPAGGPALAGKSLAVAAHVLHFDADNVIVTAAGGDLPPFDWAVVYDDSHASKALIAVSQVDTRNGGQAVTLYDGVSYGITIADIFTLT